MSTGCLAQTGNPAVVLPHWLLSSRHPWLPATCQHSRELQLLQSCCACSGCRLSQGPLQQQQDCKVSRVYLSNARLIDLHEWRQRKGCKERGCPCRLQRLPPCPACLLPDVRAYAAPWPECARRSLTLDWLQLLGLPALLLTGEQGILGLLQRASGEGPCCTRCLQSACTLVKAERLCRKEQVLTTREAENS